jgi:fatty-acyl-CoA synthase
VREITATCTVAPSPGIGVTTIPNVLDEAARRFGAAPWMAFGGQVHTFKEMHERVERIAAGLIAAGLDGDDGVAVFMANRFEWLQTQFAASTVGARLIPLNTWFRTRELTHILASSRTRLLVWDSTILGKQTLSLLTELLPEVASDEPRRWHCDRFPDLAQVVGIGDGPWPKGVIAWDAFLAEGDGVAGSEVQARAATVAPGDTALVVYTSGTTGQPKGAMLTHSGIADHMRVWAQTLGMSDRDRSVLGSPLFWIFGCTLNAMVPILSGSMLILEERFDAGRFLTAFERYGATHLQGVPDQYELLLGHPDADRRDLSTLRVVQLGGSKMSRTLPDRIRERAPDAQMNASYGLTEGVGVNTWTEFDDPFELLSTSIGHAAPDVELSLRDPDTLEPVEPGQVGEIWLRGAHITKGYFGDRAATAAAFVDGFFRTGDLAVEDQRGYLSIAGRQSHTYKRGGMNVYPAETELMLLEHPAVADVAVIGVPDERLGQVGAAFVVLEEEADLTEEELLAWCDGRLARYKLPAYVRFTDEMPRTVTGKVQKFELTRAWTA